MSASPAGARTKNTPAAALVTGSLLGGFETRRRAFAVGEQNASGMRPAGRSETSSITHRPRAASPMVMSGLAAAGRFVGLSAAENGRPSSGPGGSPDG